MIFGASASVQSELELLDWIKPAKLLACLLVAAAPATFFPDELNLKSFVDSFANYTKV